MQRGRWGDERRKGGENERRKAISEETYVASKVARNCYD